MQIGNNAKSYEKPNSGQFLGTVIDVIDLGIVQGKFGKRARIRIIWVLNANDSEGNPYRVMTTVNATMNEKSTLYGLVRGILGTVPTIPFESEILLGRSNLLFVMKEGEFANVKAVLPLPLGQVGPSIPVGFIRHKDRQNTPGGFNNSFGTSQQAPTPVVSTQSLPPSSPVMYQAPPVSTTISAPTVKADTKF